MDAIPEGGLLLEDGGSVNAQIVERSRSFDDGAMLSLSPHDLAEINWFYANGTAIRVAKPPHLVVAWRLTAMSAFGILRRCVERQEWGAKPPPIFQRMRVRLGPEATTRRCPLCARSGH